MSVTYIYDALGNREVADGITYTPNALNQYDDVDLTAFDYDNNGNLTSDGNSTFGYNEENQLISASGVLTSSYQYDALGRRVSKTVGGIPTYFVYDGDQVVEERDNAGTLIRDYLYGLGIDEVLTMTDHLSLTTYHYFYDGLGSVTEISDSAGAIQEYYVYDPYGNVEIFDASGISLGQSSVVGNRYMFTGQEFDEESGLHHYNARTYNPTIGRFHQRDPLGYYDSLNLFQYVGNNPTNFIDPWGEDTYYINNKFKSSKPTNEDVLSHSFVAITDIDPITGKEIVTKTFSWVNVNNGSWENVYNQQNKLGAQESINTGIGATKVGYSDLDPYIEKVFKTIKNQTGGYSLTGNSCHTEALDLIEEARFQLKINKIINGN